MRLKHLRQATEELLVRVNQLGDHGELFSSAEALIADGARLRQTQFMDLLVRAQEVITRYQA